MTQGEQINAALDDVSGELRKAMTKHPPLNSVHEAYAVIAEELDEFWDQVRLKDEKRDLQQMRKELIQTAAMCVRGIVDLELDEKAWQLSRQKELEGGRDQAVAHQEADGSDAFCRRAAEAESEGSY